MALALFWLAGTSATRSSFGVACCAEEVPATAADPRLGPVRSLEEMPQPPGAIEDWLRQAGVTFRIGGQRPSLVRGAPEAVGATRVFQAETQFRLSYTFRSQTRWQWQGRDLVVTIDYDDLQVHSEHEIWLRAMPDGDFWASPLVRHELDHVRISSDPRVAAHFRKRVQATVELRLTPDLLANLIDVGVIQPSLADRFARQAVRPIARRRVPLDQDAMAAIVEHIVARQFRKTVQLVQVRYRELDRVTDHGDRPVPEEGPVRRWLTP